MGFVNRVSKETTNFARYSLTPLIATLRRLSTSTPTLGVARDIRLQSNQMGFEISTREISCTTNFCLYSSTTTIGIIPVEQPRRVHTCRCPGFGPPCRRKINDHAGRVITWLFQSISTAFFSSLERCSCFNVDTIEDSDDSDQYYSRLEICNDGLEEAEDDMIMSTSVTETLQGRKTRGIGK